MCQIYWVKGNLKRQFFLRSQGHKNTGPERVQEARFSYTIATDCRTKSYMQSLYNNVHKHCIGYTIIV